VREEAGEIGCWAHKKGTPSSTMVSKPQQRKPMRFM